MDDLNSDRYHILGNDRSVSSGWSEGWAHYNRNGSPRIELETAAPTGSRPANGHDVGSIDLSGLWPDTVHYDQNNPGIEAKARDIDRRAYSGWTEKAYWLNVTRVPVCASYLAACAKVRPSTILELGTGGDSGHSTGMFVTWLEREQGPKLISVDRHPLCHVWLRYRRYPFWRFVQGDSVSVMRAMLEGRFDWGLKWWDMIFVDSSHQYEHTLAELRQASQMTNALLMDDSTFPGVKQALDEWLPENQEWLRVDMHGAVCLLERHPRL